MSPYLAEGLEEHVHICIENSDDHICICRLRLSVVPYLYFRTPACLLRRAYFFLQELRRAYYYHVHLAY